MAAPAIPDFLAQFYDPTINEGAKGGIRSTSRPPHISIETNRFSLVDAAGSAEMIRDFDIEVVVVGNNTGISRLFFDPDVPYDPTATEHNRPLCWSDNGVGPSVGSDDPQNPTCQGCPWAVWGSATSVVSGKGVPACREHKKLAILFDGQLYQLTIPPNSLKNWQTYVEFVGKHPSISINMLRTKISFDDKTQGTLKFSALGYACQTGPEIIDGRRTGNTNECAGFTTQNDFMKFMTQLRSQGPSMLNDFTGAGDKPKEGVLPAAQRMAAVADQRMATQRVSQVQAIQGQPAQGPASVQVVRPQTPSSVGGALSPSGSPDGGFLADSGQQAPARGRGRPRRGNGAATQQPATFMHPTNPAPQVHTIEPKPQQQQAFGLVDNEVVGDAEIDDAVSNAMNFDPSQFE